MRISDWSSDVCSSDLPFRQLGEQPALCPFGCSDALGDELCPRPAQAEQGLRGCPRSFAFWPAGRLKRGEERFGCGMIERGNVGFGQFTISVDEIGRASCRERVCQYVSISVVAVCLKKKPRVLT